MASADRPAKIPRLDEKILTCEICTDLIKKAKMLPCGHTFCQGCLEEWAETNQNINLACPTCRKPWEISDGSADGSVEKLPVNYVVNTMVDFVLAHQREEIINGGKRCQFCESNEATLACVECRQLACDTCAKGHKRTKMTASHQVVSLEEYRANYENQTAELRPGECDKHPGSPLKFFCQTCSVPICTDCTIIEHRVPKHKHIYLREAVKHIRNSLSENIIKIKDQLKLFDEKEADIRDVQNKLADYKEQAIREVEGQSENLLEKIRDVLRIINNIYGGKKKILDSQMDKIELGKVHLKSLLENSEKLLEPPGTDVPEMMSVYKQTQKRIKYLFDKEELQVDSQRVAPYLQYSPDLVFEKGHLGSVLSLPLTTVNVFGKGRWFFFTSGVAVSKDGEIFVVGNNCKFQVFDMNGLYKRRFKVKGLGKSAQPVAVSFTKEGLLIMITDYTEYQVCICDTNGKLLKEFGEEVFVRSAGVAVNSDGHIHVVDKDQLRVTSFTPEGRFVRSIEGYLDDQPGHFIEPDSVAINSKDQIIVSDEGGHRVQVFDSNGAFLFTFGSHGQGKGELERPRGVTVDQYDNIIVCDNGNDRIQMFSPKGDYIGRVDDPQDGIKGPYAIATVPGQPLKLIVIEDTIGDNQNLMRIL